MSVSSIKLSVAGLLLLGVALFFVSEGAEAIEPEWSYETGGDVDAVAVSADGEYIAAASHDYKVYLFDKDSNTPLWSYTIGNNVYSLAISADGEYIAVGSGYQSDNVYLFDKDSSTPLWSYTTGNNVNSMAISADGEYIVAGSWDNKVYLFDKDSGTPLWSYSTGSNVYSLAISADGEYIAVGSQDDKVYLFNKDSSSPLWSYSTGNDVRTVAISADGEYIAAGSEDYKVYLFNKDSGTPLWSYTAGQHVETVAISADGEYIAVGSEDDKVYLFDKDSSTPLWSYTTGDNVYSVAISADGKYISAGSHDDKVYLFDKESSTPLWSYDTEEDVFSVVISADGTYLAAGGSNDHGDASANVYTFKNNLTSRPSLLAYGPRSGSESTTTPQLGWFAGSDDRSNLTFDVYLDTDSDPSTKVADDITTFYYNLQCLDIDTKYYWKVIATDGEGSVTSSIINFTATQYGDIFCVSIDDDYDPAELTILKGSTVIWTNDDSSLHTVTEDDEEFDSGSISPGNTWSYTFDTIGTFDYYDQYDDDYDGQIIVLTSYPPVASIDSISPQMAELYSSVSFSGSGSDSDGTISEYKWISSIDGSLSTSASFSTTSLSFGNHTITFRVKDNDGVWSDNVTSWVDVRKSPEWSYSAGNRVCSVAISADGEYIAAGSWYGHKVYLFDKDSSTPLWSYTTGDTVESVAISANGEYIAAGSNDGKVYLFDRNSSTPLWSYDTEDYAVRSVAISADGEYIATGSTDGKIYLFGKDSSTSLWSYTTGGNVYSVSISADGEYIAVGSGDKKVYLFDKDSSTSLWSYETGSTVHTVAISADGEYIAAGSWDDKVYFFDKDGSTPLWSYTIGDVVYSVAISADGEYIVAGSLDDKVYLFDRDSSTPLWSNTTKGQVYSVSISSDGEYIVAGGNANGNMGSVILFNKDSSTPLWSYDSDVSDGPRVDISADGKYISAGSYDYNAYLFKNNPVSRPSVISYGPRSNSTILNDTTLGWFPGSDDIANLTFDVYLSFIYNDVASNNSAALIADDITNYTHLVSGLTEFKKYYWKVVATDPSGSAPSRIMNFTVGDYTAPVTNITSGPSNPSDYRNATFHFEADEDDVSFKCKMDTGSWSYCSSPETYMDLSRGTYHQFKVKATDPSGNEGEPDTWIWEILDNDIPELTNYNVSPSPAEPGQRVYFYSNFSDSDGYIIDYSWTSSIDGLLSSNGNFSTDDLSTGSHSIKLRAKDDDGDWSDNTTFNLNIGEEEENNPPELTNYNVSPNPANYGDRVYFYTNFSDSDGYIADYSWISDSDGLLSSSGNFSTDVLSTGSHSIRLRAKDNDGDWSDNTTFNLDIGEEEENNPPELTDYNVSPSPAGPGQRVYFYSNFSDSDGYIADYSWISDSDGLLSSSGNFSTDDLSAGSHSIRLRARDNDGDWSDNTTFDLNIGEADTIDPEWNYTTGAYVELVAISADGEYIVTSGSSEKVRLFHRDSSTPIWGYEAGAYVASVAISADGEYIAVGSYDDDKVSLLGKDSSTPLWSYETETSVRSVAISADGEYIAAGSSNGEVYLFDKDSSTPLWNYTTGEDNIRNVAISADGEYIVASSSLTGTYDKIFLFNRDSSTPLWSYSFLDNDHPITVAISADGEYIVVGEDNYKVYLFDKDSSTPLWTYTTGHYVYSVAITADGEYIAAGSRDKKVYLFDKDSSTPLWSYTAGDWVKSVAISADGEYITAGSGGDVLNVNKVYLFEKDSSTPLWSYTAGDRVESVAISADGEYIVAGSNDRKVYLFKNSLANNLYPIAHWKFDEGSGDIAYDSSGNGNNGTLENGPVWVDGISGSALEFDGSDDYVEFGESSLYATENQLSIAGWINMDAINERHYLVSNYNGGLFERGDLLFAYNDNNRLILMMGQESNVGIDYASNKTGEIVADRWYFVVATYDKSRQAGEKVHFFINGEQTESFRVDGEHGSGDGNGGEILNNSLNLRIGRGYNSHHADGTIDEVIIWDRALSSEEILELYDSYEISSDNNPPIVSDISISPNPAESGERINFSANYSDSDGNIIAFEWSSDIDGFLSSSGNFSTDNLSVGHHNISFRVQDDDGVWSDYIGIELIIGEPSNTEPIIFNVYINPNPAYSNERVYFSADYSDSDGNVTAFEWSSDIDGILSIGSSFDSDNLSVGHHNISFRVQDDDGAWSDYVSSGLIIEEQEEEPIPEDTSNVTSNYYFSPLEEFALTTSYEDLSTTQNYSISVQAQYDDYFGIRTNRQPVSVGTWSIGPLSSDATISIEFAEMWWEDTEGQDDSCEWTFYIYHNGGLVNDKVVSCGSNGDDLVREVYNISTSLEVNVGDMVDINIWYEGWDDVEIFYGSQSVPTGFYISGLEIEDECSFDTFMDNIYVQSPSISGPVIDEYMLLEVGKGSYHFVSEDNVYISWETTDLSGIKLDNGLPLPSKKLFTETTFDYENRIFTGKIDFALEGGTYGGAASWDYQMIFSEDYTSIIGGQIYRMDSGDKIFYTWTFGDDENYPYCALCTLTATDYYSENPFEDTTSPDEQVTTPEDGGLTLPFSGNPLAYGAIIFILGLLGAGFAAMSARQSIPGLISELQGLVDAGISDAELISALEDLENMDGLGFFSNDRTNAMRILGNYNEMTDQALGSMRQLDELQGVVDELQAAGISSPELEAEIAEIESMLNSQVEGDTNKDFSSNLFESFRKNKGGG